MTPSIEQFEQMVHTRQWERAGNAMFALLYKVDNHAGAMDALVCRVPAALTPAQRDLHICERIAAAMARLLAEASFSLSDQGFTQLMCLQRWVSLIFSCTAQRNADHVIRTICAATEDAEHFAVPQQHLTKCLFLWTVESELPLDLAQLWQQQQQMAAHLFFAWLSTNVMASRAAHQKREALLAWWPQHMQAVSPADFANWPLQVIHQVYMLCSYGLLDARHAIKKSINHLLRAHLQGLGLGDVCEIAGAGVMRQNHARHAPAPRKPTLLVVTEWFSPGFAVYRTHSMTLRALKDKFQLVGVGPKSGANAVGQAVFDVFHPTPEADTVSVVAYVRELAKQLQPDMVYHLGVGMFPHTVYLSNIRLAPIQIVSNGHGASTFSPQMDYFITDGGYISGQAAFGEKILPMPPCVMQMIPNVDMPDAFLHQVQRVARVKPDVVRVAIAAAIIKINPVFIDTLRQIALRSEAQGQRVEFHFPMAQAVGPLYHRIRAVIEGILDDLAVNNPTSFRRAFVYPHQTYGDYMRIIAQCDLFLNPLPYGNTNGIADMALLGMPGICKAGPELAEHIDVGMFKTIGLPDWCVAWTVDAYVDAALRMILQHAERLALSQQLINDKVYARLNENQQPQVMGEILLKLCQS